MKLDEEKKVEEIAPGMVTITGEDGVVYQVTGQEDGQALLMTQDGNQQCIYVTTSEQQGDGESPVLTIDTAVAEAVAQLMPNEDIASQFYVKGAEGEQTENQQMVMSIMDDSSANVAAGQEDPDGQSQVVAQVVQADEPTPGKCQTRCKGDAIEGVFANLCFAFFRQEAQEELFYYYQMETS